MSESYPHLEGGVIRDFKNMMKSHGYWEDTAWNESKHYYTFSTGTIIEFKSIDKFGKAHGPRRDVLFLNEANNISYLIADQLITRTREIVWLDWNPSTEFWFYTEMLHQRDDIDFVGEKGQYPPLTYLDNEALDKQTIGEIESHKNNRNWWKVYGLGQLGDIQSRIYTDWSFVDSVPHEAKLVKTGLDFGYSADEAAIVDIYFYNGGYILDEILYAKGMSNKQLADVLLGKDNVAIVVADSAEPKSIDELRSHGVTVIESSKGAGSLNRGINFVQAQRISVTKRSLNTIREYRNYVWFVDKDGVQTQKEDPVCKNHSMSAIRYAIDSLRPNETVVRQQLIQQFNRNFNNYPLNSNK